MLPWRTLAALIVGQVCLHGCMAGMRVAAPLSALDAGRSPLAVGVLLALFAVSAIGLALPAGRLADRHGYHRPLRLAVGMTLAGALLATASQQHAALCAAALLAGGGANVGLICIQHTAGRLAVGGTERMRVFSWLGLAPALANGVGPVLAGAAIDLGGYRVAFGALALLPLAALAVSRAVPHEPTAGASVPDAGRRRPAWELLRSVPLRRLLVVNWLLSASWDLHGFVLPLLGHARGYGASTIGAILGAFAFAVAAVRLLVPLLAHRLDESRVLVLAMLATAGVFAAYPLMRTAPMMAGCAVCLGLALGAVQPMVMSTLHAVTPHDRHGEAIALRSMTINLSSSLMPLLFGLVGASLGAAALFWAMGAAVAAGSWQARLLGAVTGSGGAR